MREIAADLRRVLDADVDVALATIVAVAGSSPRPVGATMAVTSDGEVLGSLSGGCVEAAVVAAAEEVLATGASTRDRFGIADEVAFEVGLTCGGVLDVLVAPLDDRAVMRQLLDDLEQHRPVALATTVDGPGAGRLLLVESGERAGSLGSEGLDAAAGDDALGLLALGRDDVLRYGPDGERRVDAVGVLVRSFAPAPRMLVYGAIDFAAAVARVGTFLGYRVTVCDARPVFATRTRFPDVDEVVVAWPHDHLAAAEVDERTVICVLTHDPKFDVPLLEVALRGPAAYVGAMGSRRTHGDRLERLRERGLSPEELARLRSPVGLDIGARTPEETAVSIAAEVVQLRWGGSGRPLSATEGPIHRSATPA